MVKRPDPYAPRHLYRSGEKKRPRDEEEPSAAAATSAAAEQVL